MKTLIITESYDATTDILIQYIGSENIFRLNFDLYQDIKIKISENSIYLQAGKLVITDNEIEKVLWRKPFNSCIKFIDKYYESELKYIFRELFNLFSKLGKTILVIPNHENYLGKLTQMTVGTKYFEVPDWNVTLNENIGIGSCVAKSLSTEIVGNGKVIFTTPVDKENLHEGFPWFLQDKINASHDITIVYIAGKIFSYELKRNAGTIDWRKNINRFHQEWDLHKVPIHIEENITNFMNELKLKFGRLDFLYDGINYYFLEVNPNGQWAWLDIRNENGLMEEMINQISPNCTIKSIVKI
jgi:hypothetical protein